MEREEWWKVLDGLGLGGEWRDGVGRWGKRNGCGWLGEEGGEFFRAHLVSVRRVVSRFVLVLSFSKLSLTDLTSSWVFDFGWLSNPNNDLPHTLLPNSTRQTRIKRSRFSSSSCSLSHLLPFHHLLLFLPFNPPPPQPYLYPPPNLPSTLLPLPLRNRFQHRSRRLSRRSCSRWTFRTT